MVTAAPLAATCTPRPAVGVSTTTIGQGVVRVTITAATGAGVTLQQLQFETTTGALIDIGQQTGRTGNFVVDVAGQATSTFNVRQAGSGQAATVPLTVVDTCGSWHTFVGGGASAFVPPTTAPPPTPTRTATPIGGKTTTAALSVDLGSTNQQVLGGQTVVVYWSGVPSPGTSDQIGLYLTRDESPQNNRLPPANPVLTNGTVNGFANVVLGNDVLDAIYTAQATDYFEFVLYRSGAGTTPTFVQRSNAFQIVRNTAASAARAPGAIPPPARADLQITASDAPPLPSTAQSAPVTSGKPYGPSTAVTPNRPLLGDAPVSPPGAYPEKSGPVAPRPRKNTGPTSPESGAKLTAPHTSAPHAVQDAAAFVSDSFAAAPLISALPSSFAVSTASMTTEAGEPLTCNSAPLGATVWFKIAPGTTPVTIDTFGSSFDAVLGVYTGSAVNALTPVICNDDTGGLQARVAFSAVAGTTYYVQVSGFNGAVGNLLVHLGRGAPANDSFVAASAVSTLPASRTATTDSATSEAGEPTFLVCNDVSTAIAQTVWYAFTPPSSGLVTIDTFTSTFDTVLGVYTGSALNTLAMVACDHDAAGIRQSRVTFSATGGTTYRVQVGGSLAPNPALGGTLGPVTTNTAGNLVVNFAATAPPANNNFTAAAAAAIPSTAAALTSLATTEGGEPTTFTCDGFTTTVGNTVWYTVTPPASSVVTIDTFDSDFDTVLAVYTGSAVNALTQVACSDQLGVSSQSQVSFVSSATPGTIYRVQVGGYLGDSGELLIHFASAPNDSFAAPYFATGLQFGNPVQFSQLTNSATTEPLEPTSLTCGGSSVTVGRTLWYAVFLPLYSALNPPASNVQIDTFGSESGFDTVVAVYTGNALNSLSQVACNDDSGGIQSQVQFYAAPNTLYYVQVGGFNGDFGRLVLNFTYLAPVNDNFAAAVVVPGTPLLYGEPTFGATMQSGAGEPTPSCAPVGRSVWFAVSHSAETPLLVTSVFSNFDTVIGVYTGSALNSLSQVTCNDDSFGTLGSTVSFTMNPNTWYYVQISGYNYASFGPDWGNLYPLFLAAAPSNDNFAGATTAAAFTTRRLYTLGATIEPGENPVLNCGGPSVPIGRSVWYRYTPGARGVSIDTFGSTYDTVLTVYTSTTGSLNNLSPVTCNDNAASTTQSQVNFTGAAGVTYYVQASGRGNGLGVEGGTLVINFN